MTLLSTVQDAAREIGLRSPSTVTGAADANTRRLYRLALRSVAEVQRRHDWTAAVKLASINATGGSIYSLPSDFDRLCRDSTWNTTDSWRVRGASAPAGWQTRINGWAVSTASDAAFRIVSVNGVRSLEFDPAPDSGDVITYQYVSDAVFDTGSALVSSWSADSYTCILDEDLISLGVVWRALRSIGRRYADERAEFEQQMREEIAHDLPAETLLLGGPGDLILPAVVPDTGYG